jgi:hypothetical protein
LPARAALLMRAAWVSVVVQIATASTSGDASTSSTEPAAGTPSAPARLAAAGATTS